MAELVYLLCALASAFCAVLLVRSYRVQHSRLLLWSSLCFVGLAVSNAVMFVDLVIVPATDLLLLRSLVALDAVSMLLIGLIWESK